MISAFAALPSQASGLLRYAPALIMAAGACLIGFAAGKLFWIVASGASHTVPLQGGVSSAAAVSVSGDYSLLERQTPFKATSPLLDASDLESPSSIDAPETDLDLTLHGLIASGDEAGRAIVSSDGAAQKNYGIGDTVENAGGAVISRIYADSVLLDREGTIERLRFKGLSALSPVNVAPPAPSSAESPAPPTPAPEETRPPAAATNASARLTRQEFITLVSSVRIDSNTGDVGEGVSVFPTSNSQIFNKSGLRAGDVVTRANGSTVDGPDDLRALMSELEETGEIQLFIVRGNENRELTLRIDE